MAFPDVELERYMDYLDQGSSITLTKCGMRRGCEYLGYKKLETEVIIDHRLYEIERKIDWERCRMSQGNWEQDIITQAEALMIVSLLEKPLDPETEFIAY